MEHVYPTLLSPILRRGFYIRNRMGASRAYPPFSAGVAAKEPLTSSIPFTASFAKNGAAIVTCRSTRWDSRDSRAGGGPFPPMPPEEEQQDVPIYLRALDGPPAPGSMSGPDLTIANVKLNYIHTAQAIHDQGSLAIMSLMEVEPSGWTIDEIPEDALARTTDDFALRCRQYQALGYDGCGFYMCYRSSLLAQSLSPALNHRNDRYGCPTALALEAFQKVREACGEHFLIEIEVSGQEIPGGYTLEDMSAYLRVWEPYIDIVQVRAETVELAHPIGANSSLEAPRTLSFAKELKQSGTSLLIAPIGGFHDPARNEQFLREGSADLIYMARAFVCDSHYYEKLVSGHGADITPCIRCNKCHTKPAEPEPGCSVNPLFSMSILPGFQEPERAKQPKRVAVIGGGPAGMEAALTAAALGHETVLFERENQLGGQLNPAGTADFKWPVRMLKEHLIRQLEKSAVTVKTGTEATPELIAAMGFEAVILALGAEPVQPNIPGAEFGISALSVYENPEQLAQQVVVVGGSETGLETALFLARRGHQVTLLTRREKAAYNAHDVHYREIMEEIWQKEPKLHIQTRSQTVEIGPDYVVYQSAGERHKLPCGSVVLSCGMVPRQRDVTRYGLLCPSVHVIGDCRRSGDIRNAMRDGYAAACRI